MTATYNYQSPIGDTTPTDRNIAAFEEYQQRKADREAQEAADFTRSRLYQNNAAQWLITTLEALADQADFTPSAVLNDLCETYWQKAAGL